jgi:replicative DNA helicase
MIENIPYHFEAEQAVLGAIIFDNSVFNSVSNILQPHSFHEKKHRSIYKAIIELSNKNQPIDEILLGEQLEEFGKLEEVGGYAYLSELVDCVPSSGNIVYYAKVLEEDSLLRDLISLTSDINRKARDPQQSINDLLIELDTKASELTKKRSKKSTKSIHDVICQSVSKYEERSKIQGDIIGLPTGFFDLDKIISGLTAPDLITIAADSGVGKTTLALNIIEHIYTRTGEKRGCFICSREMANYQVVDRMICSVGRLNARYYKRGKLQGPDMDRMIHAADSLSPKNIWLNDDYQTKDQVVYEMKYLHKAIEGGLCLGVIDYLQLLQGTDSRSREREIADISSSMKSLAKELDIPIIQLSQLNRDLKNRSDKRPIRSDLRESAAIEHDSDIILFLYRDEVYNDDSEMKGFAELEINKARNDDTGGRIILKFVGSQNRFTNTIQEEKNQIWNIIKNG